MYKDNFCFTDENLSKAQMILTRYPKDQAPSAILPLLRLAQRQCNGWLPHAAIEYIAQFLGISFIRAYEVATFYTMFNLKPVGAYHIQICTTTPCWLRGSDKIVAACEKELEIKHGEVTHDQLFSICEVECLGACVNAPVIQINDDYFEDMTEEKTSQIISELKADKQDRKK